MQNKKLNFAAIDIGSNAVRLLIKSVNDGDSPDKMTKTVRCASLCGSAKRYSAREAFPAKRRSNCCAR